MPTRPEIESDAAGGLASKVRPDSLSPGAPLISIRDLHVNYALRTNAVARLIGRSSGTVRAVDGVNLDLKQGEVVGIVGESGSGKSTLGRALLGLVRAERRQHPLSRPGIGRPSGIAASPDAPQVANGVPGPARLTQSVNDGRASDLRRPANPRVARRPARRGRSRSARTRRPGPGGPVHAEVPGRASGGQKQRAVIARAIALGPELLVADEPISMLDMSVRAKILGLLEELKTDLGLTYVYITHDLASARFFCDRIAIMYLGKVIEIGPYRRDLRESAPPLHASAAQGRAGP